MKQILLFFAFHFALLTSLAAQTSREWGQWHQWGEQPDGTFLNPVIPADYSDLDCIRVGDDYYAISSTMQFSPGMTILHSRDLVNWEIAGNAVSDLTQISQAMGWQQMDRYGRGIWAGSLRHHEGRFYLYFGTPDEGFFMTSAPKAEGPWEPLTCLLAESGWDDCSAIWDQEGQAWFVGTCFREGYKTYIFRMAPDGRSIDRASARLVNEGYGREANKLIYHDGYYYLIFSEHRDGIGRYVMVKRDRQMTGSFSEERQLLLPCVEANEPNQGGIIEGPTNNPQPSAHSPHPSTHRSAQRDAPHLENSQLSTFRSAQSDAPHLENFQLSTLNSPPWYFLTHHGSGDWSGRIVSLLPVTWQDGWPMMGDLTEKDKPGKMVWQGAMPNRVKSENLKMKRGKSKVKTERMNSEPSANGGIDERLVLQRSDDFDAQVLGVQWQWNYQPRADYFSLTDRRGWVRLYAFRPLEAGHLLKAGNTLTQRSFRTPDNEVTTRLDIRHLADGQHAGLCHFAAHSGCLGVVRDGGQTHIELRRDDQAEVGSAITAKYIWLRSTWGLDGLSEFAYSTDGKHFTPFGTYQLSWGFYRGDRIGIYCYNDLTDSGYVDVDFLHYTCNR